MFLENLWLLGQNQWLTLPESDIQTSDIQNQLLTLALRKWHEKENCCTLDLKWLCIAEIDDMGVLEHCYGVDPFTGNEACWKDSIQQIACVQALIRANHFSTSNCHIYLNTTYSYH